MTSPTKPDHLLRQRLQVGGLILGSIIITLGILEILGRLFLTPLLVTYSNNQMFKLQLANPSDLGVATLYVPHHYYLYGMRSSYRSADGRIRHNALGCRAEEITKQKAKGRYRIFTIGGSTTYGTFVRENEKTYTYQLERLLNQWAKARHSHPAFEVVNCGVPGATSAENLSRYIFALSEYGPDMVMIQQGINDAIPRTLPQLSRDYREFSKPWQEFDPEKNKWFLKRLVRAAQNRFGESIWTQGINYLVRRPFWDKKQSGADAANSERNGAWVFESNTRYLVRLAQADRVRVLLLSEHMSVDHKDADWRTLPLGRARTTFEHNEVLKQVARSEGALFLDLQQKLCACKEIMPDGRHLNEEGETQKAQVIFEYLTSPAALPHWYPEASRPDNT